MTAVVTHGHSAAHQMPAAPSSTVLCRCWGHRSTHGHRFSHMGTHGHTWAHMGTHDHTASHISTHQHAWSHMVTHGHTWSHIITHGHAWSHMVTHGHTWPHMVTHGHTCIVLRAMGVKMSKLSPTRGFAAELATALTITVAAQ